MTLFHFDSKSDLKKWLVIDDVVMGGKSYGNFVLNESENAVFEGYISLENNGGFSMVQHFCPTLGVSSYSKVVIRLKGDGKSYQFRVKSSQKDFYAYVAPFKTSGHWETIEIPFESMYPAFRGKTLNVSNFSGDQMEMIAFFIGTNKEESFLLEIERIDLV